jgi:hypothetical protein
MVMLRGGSEQVNGEMPGQGARSNAAREWPRGWRVGASVLHTHPMHLEQTRVVQGIDQNRVLGIAAAVAPKPGHMAIYLSQVSGCTSLLEMNDESARNPSVMNSFFRGGDKTFRNFADSRGGHLACVEKVKGRRNREIIPVVRGDFFVSMIPSNVKLVFLSTDAQGFDLQVVSSFGTTLPDIDVIQVECQDLPEGHAMFLTRGAFSCADVQACMQVYSTDHVMVAAATGQPHNSCTINSPNNERNCLFRRMDRPYFTKTPNLLRRDAYDVAYPQRDNLQCPPLTQPAGVSTVPDDIDAD